MLVVEYRVLHIEPFMLRIERSLSHQHLVGQDAQAPQIEGLVVLFVDDAAVGAVVAVVVPCSGLFVMAVSPTESAKFGHSVAQPDILSLHLAVVDIVVLQLLECYAELPDYKCRLQLGKFFRRGGCQLGLQRATLQELQNEVYVFGICEAAIKLHDVGVVKMGQ